MPAEIAWSTRRTGALRFGPYFRAAVSRDPYAGCGTVTDNGNGSCEIGPLAGEMTTQDRNDILDCCANWGFTRARVERNGKQWEYDLTQKPYKRMRLTWRS